jgi:hypothetical protein
MHILRRASQLPDVDAIVHCAFAGGKACTIEELWPDLKHSVKWIHSLSAGIDSLVPVLQV